MTNEFSYIQISKNERMINEIIVHFSHKNNNNFWNFFKLHHSKKKKKISSLHTFPVNIHSHKSSPPSQSCFQTREKGGDKGGEASEKNH